MIKTSTLCSIKIKRNTRNYKRASDWRGFWITPDLKVTDGQGAKSHQEILDKEMGPDATYSDAFNKGWVRGFFQSGEACFETRSLVGQIFNYIQSMVQEKANTYRVNEVMIDLNGRTYAAPLKDFLSLNKSSDLRPFQL